MNVDPTSLSLNDIPQIVRDQFLEPHLAVPVQRATGGLSSARVYKCRSSSGDLCLRCWPDSMDSNRLQLIVQQIDFAKSHGIHVLPKYFQSASGKLFWESAQGYWELTQWMPGDADYLDSPNATRLKSALTNLAQLHLCWSDHETSSMQKSPAVQQRIDLLSAALRFSTASFPRTDFDHNNVDIDSLCQRTLGELQRRGKHILSDLYAIVEHPVLTHFVLRDIWSDHVLFLKDTVTGIIDFGAARIDEPATDVARLLGSLEPHSSKNWNAGFEAYCKSNPHVDLKRVQIIDRASCLLSAVQWMKWLMIEQKKFTAPQRELIARWRTFLDRLALIDD